MMLNTRFVERDTGVEVLVSTPQQWEGYEVVSLVTYPDGMVYALPDKDISLYFEIVRPQEVRIVAAGATASSRPTAAQRSLLEDSKRLALVKE
jgi:hypothetical protein